MIKMRKTIKITLGGYLHLAGKQRMERTGKALSKKGVELLTKNFERFSCEGYKVVGDGDFGGMKNGIWTDWSTEDMAKMLQVSGYEYKNSGNIRYSA